MNVFIYRTDIATQSDMEAMEDLLDMHSSIIRWNVDREDVDKVLKIESTCDNSEELLQTIVKAGYFCEELPD